MLNIEFSSTHVKLSSGAELKVSGTIELEPGTIALVVGDNGAGKSTILSLVHSILDYEEKGRIIAIDWASISSSISDSPCTYVFQEPRENFICRSSADEIILPLLSPHHTAEETVKRLGAIVDATDVHRTELFEKKIDHLSSGEQQKVAIAAAMATEPTVMIWDEALARIDRPAAARIAELVQAVQGDTILIASTHRPERYIRLFGDRVVSLLNVTRKNNCIQLSQTDISEARSLPSQLTLDRVNFVSRPLWRAYPGKRKIDPVAQLFSNGFRVFGGLGPKLLEIDRLEIFARDRRIVMCPKVELREGVNFVVGRNGSGKTTLLSVLAGHINLNAYQFPILWRNRLRAEGDVGYSDFGTLAGMRKQGLSIFLPAEPFRWLLDETVIGELARFHGGSTLEERLEILAQAGIEEGSNPEYLSYGQRKLLSLLTVPSELELVCLDEPFADLGMRYMKLVEQLILRQCESRRWRSVAVSHSSDLELAEQ